MNPDGPEAVQPAGEFVLRDLRPRTRWYQRWWVWAATLGPLLAAGPVVFFVSRYLHEREVERELNEVIAELNKSDPGWQLADLDTEREWVPPKENAVFAVLAARRMWTATVRQDAYEIGSQIGPVFELTPQQTDSLRATLKKLDRSLKEARKLTKLPNGYPGVPRSVHNREESSYHIFADSSRLLLQWDLFLACHDQENDRAAELIVAMLNLSRSIGHEPFADYSRLNIIRESTYALERLLAQGEISDASLKKLQDLFENETFPRQYVKVLRAERAIQHYYLTQGETGQLTYRVMMRKMHTYLRRDRSWFTRSEIQRAHTQMLRDSTKAIELSALAAPHNLKRLEAFYDTIKKKRDDTTYPRLAEALAPICGVYVKGFIQTGVKVDCTMVALACERYRRKYKRWPNSLETLVTEDLIGEIPTDSTDGKKLRYLRTNNGIATYANGYAREKMAARINNPDVEEYRPNEFRLWNPDKRRQTPPPKKK